MAISKEMRLLKNKWDSGQHWPKRLDALEITGLRGWTGQRVDFRFPIVSISGENGAGKSTVLQAAASIYKPLSNQTGPKKKLIFASTFFPETPWEKIESATIKWWVHEGSKGQEGSIRKFPAAWRGNPNRRERNVENIDLSRIQPVSARVGYSRLAKSVRKKGASSPFDAETTAALSNIMGKKYKLASMSATDIDANRLVPVIAQEGNEYSGFHSGAGETMMAEFLRSEIPKHSLVLIDEIETSLHPRAQRRLMRQLAEISRVREVQFIVSTHSPYVLEELPEEARLYVWEGKGGKEIIRGVSPQFAMTKMDLEHHPECDVYVEDEQARRMLLEILAKHARDLVQRVSVVAYGSAGVGASLGQMAKEKRFPRATCVFRDGDQEDAAGCMRLPGDDAPERVVFGALDALHWNGIASRVGRDHSAVADACSAALTIDNHHEWLTSAANKLVLGTDTLWTAMCAEWADKCLSASGGKQVTDYIQVALV
jgi:predicted ATPase